MPEKKAHTIYKTKDGARVPSVTTIIGSDLGWNKNMLMAWTRKLALAGQDPEKVRDEAASVGTLAHAMIHDYLAKETTVDLSAWTDEQVVRASQGYGAYVDWERQNNVQCVLTEEPIVSEEQGYGGTLDLVAWIGTTLTIVDFKTSAAVYPEHLIQLAAYQMLWEEKTEPHVLCPALIIQLDKDNATFSVHSYPDLSAEREAFKCLLTLHKLHGSIKP